MNIRKCAALTAAAGVMIGLQVIAFFLPLTAVIRNLTADTGKSETIQMPAMTRAISHPLFGIALIAITAAAVVLSIAGLRRETAGKGRWVLLTMINLFALLAAGFSAFIIPKFIMLYKNVGIR